MHMGVHQGAWLLNSLPSKCTLVQANLLRNGELSRQSSICSGDRKAPLLVSWPNFSKTNIMREDKVSSWEHIWTALHLSFTSHMTILTYNDFHMNCILELLLFNDIAYCKWCFSCTLTSTPLSAASSNLLLYKHPMSSNYLITQKMS